MNLLNRDLDDPFVYPPGFHAECYVMSRRRRLTLSEAWRYAPAIDFLCLTVDFGGMLKRRLVERGLRAYAGSPPDTPRAGADAGPEAAPPRSRAAVLPLPAPPSNRGTDASEPA